ncbi:hypothetical protein ABW19_dt0208794 [Dactylella cylindrospora]|nr:hypothetical protein ABW19_dt0208794 [Dactylella cylindrospora]
MSGDESVSRSLAILDPCRGLPVASVSRDGSRFFALPDPRPDVLVDSGSRDGSRLFVALLDPGFLVDSVSRDGSCLLPPLVPDRCHGHLSPWGQLSQPLGLVFPFPVFVFDDGLTTSGAERVFCSSRNIRSSSLRLAAPPSVRGRPEPP